MTELPTTSEVPPGARAPPKYYFAKKLNIINTEIYQNVHGQTYTK